PPERARAGGVVRLALLQPARVLEERPEELALVGRRTEREPGMPLHDVRPFLAHLGPERVRALAVATRGGVVEADDALVAVQAQLLRDHRVRGDRTSALVEHDLQVLFLLDPARRRDRVPVRTD